MIDKLPFTLLDHDGQPTCLMPGDVIDLTLKKPPRSIILKRQGKPMSMKFEDGRVLKELNPDEKQFWEIFNNLFKEGSYHPLDHAKEGRIAMEILWCASALSS